MDEMIMQDTKIKTSWLERDRLEERFGHKLQPNYGLTRALVSFQANKNLPLYRWFKYKEGFSAPMVEYFLQHSDLHHGTTFLDPFAGSGVALFAMQSAGWRATGIELLPVGRAIVEARSAAKRLSIQDWRAAVSEIAQANFLECYCSSTFLPEINITRGAYPCENKRDIDGYLSFLCSRDYPDDVRTLLSFAALCVLESVSYTRKDGQYLRWDYRAPRANKGTSFDKGDIPSFKEALVSKLAEITEDISSSILLPEIILGQPLDLIQGSVLDKIHGFPDQSIDLVITSPPYLNRYDYTRTYALELAFLGIDDKNIKNLRQDMVSCTVENREKEKLLADLYIKHGKLKAYEMIIHSFQNQRALQEVIARLEELKDLDKLNNSNIVRYG